MSIYLLAAMVAGMGFAAGSWVALRFVAFDWMSRAEAAERLLLQVLETEGTYFGIPELEAWDRAREQQA